MLEVFACPECGRELGVEGFSPGREVQCEECSTWVEVPFLPRASQFRRPQRSIRPTFWGSKLLRGAIAFAVVALLSMVAIRVIGGKVRSGREQVLTELLASADEAESYLRLGDALREIEAALAHARSTGLDDPDRVDDLVQRRDRISLKEADSRLAGVDALPPDSAVGESETLSRRAEKDTALAPLVEAIGAKLDQSRVRRAKSELAEARRAFDNGQDPEAFAAAARLHDHAGGIGEPLAESFRLDALSILENAVGRTGVALPPVDGRFVAGSAVDYETRLREHRAEVFRSRGYFPQPRSSPWSHLWDEKAPFRSTVHLVETREELYLQSRNRTTQVDGTFEVEHEGRVVWKTRVVARTRSPLPNLPAYLAGHLATAGRHDPEAERRFHDDAVLQFVEQAARNLRATPSREVALTMP